MATTFVSAASAQGSGEALLPLLPLAPPRPPTPTPRHRWGQLAVCSPSATSPNATAETGGASLDWVAALAVVASGVVTLGLVGLRGGARGARPHKKGVGDGDQGGAGID